jgi:predicted MPP superfamily phosphohydrolase
MAQLGSFSGVDSGRRSFITGAAAAIPMFTIGTSINGLVSARSPVVMPNIELFFPHLPRELEGMRILHISDIHIGYYIDLHDLELTLLDAERQHADLVLVSGDIADQLTELPEALRMIDRLKPRYGTFGSLGNHEYYAGIDTVLRCFDAGPIPLLRNSGMTIPVGGAQLYVGGADDPVTMGDRSAKERFLASSVDRAWDGAPSNAFHLLMSHRPEGLDIAAERRIPMTIAGHTHAGGQIGWNGRSFIEQFIGGRYLWGHYRKSGSQLYTSAGTGHWFPFRLGVPREAPVYILRGEV